MALHGDCRQSYLSLGKKVSLSAPVVQIRLARLKRLGILQGFQLSPDPGIFGRDDAILLYNGQYSRDDARRIVVLPNVVGVAWKVDGGLSVRVWPRKGEDASKSVKFELKKEPSWQTITPRPKLSKVSYLDLTLIDALLDDPRVPLKDLIYTTGLSPKTIRKHIDSLLRNRLIAPRPRLGALTDTGELVFQLLVFGRVPMEDLRKILVDAILMTRMEEPPTRNLLCRASNLNDAMSKIQAVEKLPGVENATITLNREFFVATDFLHRLVREEMNQRNPLPLQISRQTSS